MFVILILLVLIVSLLFSWVTLLKDYKRFNVPGPTPLPLIGNGHLFLTKPSGFLPCLHDLKVKFGDTYRVFLFHNSYIVFSHPKYVEPLVSHNDMITKGRSYYFLRPWLGDGLLTSTGHRWKTTRKFLTPAFHFNILQNFLPVFLKNEKILIKKLADYANEKPFDVFPIVVLTALDNVTESIMGVSIDAQNNSESNYVKSIEVLAGIVATRMRNLFLGEDAIFNLLPHKTMQDKALKILHSQTNKVIEIRREELKNTNMETNNENSEIGIKNKHAFLDLLLLSTVDGEKVSNEQVREEVDTFMFEGHDTTSAGIAFTLYCLSKHPEAQEKILQEQKHILGDNLNRDPTYTELKQMKYLELVIKESLRLYPSVPLIERHMVKDTEIADIKIGKNTNVIVNIFEMHRHPDLFDNPMEFRPERHDTTESRSGKHAFNWLAFSAGPRNCIGQKFAMMELKVTIASIVKHYVILPADVEEPELTASLILRSENGVYVMLKTRNT